MNRVSAQKLQSLLVLLIATCLVFTSLTVSASSGSPVPKEKSTEKGTNNSLKPNLDKNFGNLPLSFEPNRGQANRNVKFLSRGSGYLLTLSSTQASLRLRGSTSIEQLHMNLLNSDPRAKVTAEAQQDGVSNYLIGGDRAKWRRKIPNYSRVRVAEAYPGIDVLYYGSDQQRLEFDFIVRPGADPNRIQLNFDGAESIRIDDEGALRLKMKESEVVQPAPIIYQVVEGTRRPVDGRFKVSGSEVTFLLGEYDLTKELVIDPQVIYASFHGGNGDDRGKGIAVDRSGNVFLVGSTLSTNLNVTGGVDGDDKGMDAFIVKINPTGSQRVFSTYLGGNGFEDASAVAVTSDGKACVTGAADVFVFDPLPTTLSRYQGPNAIGGGELDAFLTVLTAQGDDLFYSTFIGGSGNDFGEGVAVDASNKVYVSGSATSFNFPRKNSGQDKPDEFSGFVAKFDPAESGNDSLVYSTLIFGENGRTDGTRVAVTPNGVAFTTGTTEATDLPVKSSSSLPPFQNIFKGGGQDIYIAKVSGNGTLDYLTYFGGDGLEIPGDIAVDANERVYVTGTTASSAQTFPLKNAFDTSRTSTNDTFVAKLNADGTALFYSTLFSPSSINNQANALALDSGGDVYIAGVTVGNRILSPINGFQADLPDGGTFVAKIERSNATGTNTPQLLYFDTFAGGDAADAALDTKGNLYVVGSKSTALPASLTAGVFQPNFGGAPNDAVVFKVSSTFPDTIGVYRPSTQQFLLRNSNSSGAPDITRTFGVANDLPVVGDWNGDGTDDIGVFRPSTGQFLLRVPVPLFPTFTATIVMNFGQQGDLPVAGDWDRDGFDTPGVFRPSTNEWILTNGPNVDQSTPPVNFDFFFGQNGAIPIVGDWDGDGIDTPGFYLAAFGQFNLSNTFLGTIDITPFQFGNPATRPLAGDWNGDGVTTIGVYDSSISRMALNNTNTTGNTVGDIVLAFGQNGDLALAGNWDGKP